MNRRGILGALFGLAVAPVAARKLPSIIAPMDMKGVSCLVNPKYTLDDLIGVQPLTGATGLIFALRSPWT